MPHDWELLEVGAATRAVVGVHAGRERSVPSGEASWNPGHGRYTQLFHAGRECAETTAVSVLFDYGPRQSRPRPGQPFFLSYYCTYLCYHIFGP